MNNDYLDSLNRLARKRQLVLTKEQEKAIYRVYAKATEDYYEKFINSMGNGTATNALQMEYAREMATRLQAIVEEYSIKGAENSLSIAKDVLDKCYDEYGLKDTPYAKAVHQITNAVLDNSARRIILGDIYKDGVGLSQRIWNVTNRQGEKINEVIAACMAQQLSAVETSKILKDFMKPGANTTWDKAKIKEKLGPGYAAWNKELSYEAFRLARTTINHSATLAMKEASRANPYLKSARWHSVHAIGRTCEQCKERDGQVYSLAKLPFDHPNGLCWNEPILDKSLDKIAEELNDWVNGKPNSRLDEYWKANGPKNIPLPSKVNTATAKPNGRDEKWVDRNFKNMRTQIGEKHWPAIRDRIANAPEFLQDLYKAGQKNFVYGGTRGTDAFYSPSTGKIVMDFSKDLKKSNGANKVFFHEYGHYLDDLFGNGEKVALFRTVASEDRRFFNAIKEDYENLLQKAKDDIVKKGGSVDIERNMIMAMHKLQANNGKDLSSGAQDIISGLSLNKYNYQWGHSTEYWTRGNTNKEIASEAWAHMSAAYAVPEVGKHMKNLFPKAMETFKTLVQELL